LDLSAPLPATAPPAIRACIYICIATNCFCYYWIIAYKLLYVRGELIRVGDEKDGGVGGEGL